MKIAEMAVKCCTRTPKAYTAEECFKCEFKNGMCDSYKLAKILCEEGYEKTDELKKHVADLRNRLHLIWAIGCDYDGCNTVKSLKELIDELVSYTQLPTEEVHDITSRAGRWIKAECSEKDGDATCSACGHWDWSDCNYCSNCGAKMRSDE